jgi:hypothetical protein
VQRPSGVIKSGGANIDNGLKTLYDTTMNLTEKKLVNFFVDKSRFLDYLQSF